MENGHIGWLKVADISVEFLIHVLEDAAIFEGKTTDLLDMFIMLLNEHKICDAEGLKEYNGLPIQKSSLVLVPV